MTPLDLCVVIPVLNEVGGIAAAIESAADAGQIIVVDGGSTDGTLEIVRRFPRVTLISSPPGRGRQLAAGARCCDRQAIVFLHGDCVLSGGSLGRIADAIETGHPWGALRQRIAAAGLGYRLLELGNAARVQCRGMVFGDQALFVAAELYAAVGGIEGIPLMEDVRLSQRLRRRSWPVLLDATVEVSARRWTKRGILYQTALNWLLQGLHAAGVPPERLRTLYR
ncbi:MAG: TIGR04283 family arsenosugar biosynthesis glycosyltransferase [Planctomycetaceae bacterium]